MLIIEILTILTKIHLKLMAESQSGAIKFKLVNVSDWPKFFAHYNDKNVVFDEVLDKLDNCSLLQLYHHFDDMINDGTLWNCLVIFKIIAKQRKFDVNTSQPTIESNPPAPFKK